MSSTSADPQRKIILKSCDGVTFEVDETVANASQTIKNLIKDNSTVTSIPLPNVTAEILEKVVKYCQRHVEAAANASASRSENNDDLKAFDAEFVKVDQGTLIQIILAAHYLDIKSLTDITCQAVADMIKGKTPDEIRRTFNMTNDFTPEEEAEHRRQMPWVFE